MPSYTDCLRRFGDDNKWIAFIDCDEFLVPKQTDSIVNVLQLYPFSHHVAGLQVNWILFGSSGYLTPPNGLVIENYIQSTGKEWEDNLHTKAIVQPQYTVRAGSNPHYFTYKAGYHSIGENSQIVSGAFSTVHCNDRIQINHYTTKSLQEFEAKLAKGRADAVHLPGTNMAAFDKLNAGCIQQDTSIQRFIPAVKELLKNR